ncbi:MAG: cytochrome P450, partial [Spongiibacter sp.]
PPVKMLPRVSLTDVEVGDTVIPGESFVLSVMASGNEDDLVFGSDAAQFCPGRKNANKHHSFGAGPHLCVGNMLARAELKTITRLLVEKVDSIEIAEELSFESYEPVVLDINMQLKKLMLRMEGRK